MLKQFFESSFLVGDVWECRGCSGVQISRSEIRARAGLPSHSIQAGILDLNAGNIPGTRDDFMSFFLLPRWLQEIAKWKKKQQTTNQSEIWFEFWVVVCGPRSRTQWSLGIPSSSGHSVTYDNLGTERDVENFPKKLWFPKGNYCLYATLLVSLLILLLCENICQAMILAAHVFSAAGGR